MVETPSDYDNSEQLLKILLAREHARADAWLRKDHRALDALLAPDYFEINNFGRFSREDILARIFPLLTLHSFTIEEPHVKRIGADTAVITYQCTEDSTMGRVRKNGTFPVTAHYSLMGKMWKISLWQITPTADT
jgi:hypothetical protein